jgi:serine/threonine protein kinase/WD40 repeat protein/tetratricopeptide (TPR) repeat protein
MTGGHADGSIVDPLDILAEEFIRRLREGKHPSLSEYTARHPELAGRIRTLFPALVEMEQAGSAVRSIADRRRRAAPLGDRIGEFRILRKLGEGGMGVVYEAVQESLGRHVALKVLSQARDATDLERFRREARTAARLHHTNIVPVFAVGEADGLHYYAMQFIHGQGLDLVLREVRALRVPESIPAPDARSLAASVARSLHDSDFAAGSAEADSPSAIACPTTRTDLPGRSESVYYREVARLGAQGAEALAYAHGQGVLHRDIKPSNLLLDTRGTLWITDFGLAKADDSGDLTHTGDLVGTLRYMAPERLRGRSEVRSDVYALGATLYELLALRPAFPDSDRLALLERIARQPPPSLRSHEPRIPRDLETIVLKAMARDPADRYGSAAELADDLHRFQNDRPIQARRASPAEELRRWARRNPVVAGLTGSIVLLLALFAVGAALAAIRVGRARDRALQAERERTRQLAQSLLDQARAARFSRRPGQRFESLDAIRRANLLARQSAEPEAFFDELRTQAIASLALPDVRIATPDASAGPPLPGFLAAAADRYFIVEPSGHLRIVRMQDNGEIARLPIPPGHPAVRTSHDGSVIAVRSNSGGFRAWDLRRSNPAPIWDETTGARAHDVRSDGGELALARDDGTITLRVSQPGEFTRQFATHGLPRGLAYAPDGRWLAGALVQSVEIRDCRTGGMVADSPQPGPVTSMSWRADSRRLAVACSPRIFLWDVPSGREVHQLSTRDANTVVFSIEGDLLLHYGWRRMLEFYDPNDGHTLLSFQPGSSVVLGRDGNFMRIADGHPVRPLEVATGREYLTLERPAAPELEIAAIAVHPGGRLLAAAMKQATLLWDLASGQQLGRLPGPCEQLAFDDAGGLIVHLPWGLYRWPIRTGSPGRMIVGPPARIDAPEPDGLRVVASSRDGQVIAGTFANGPGVIHLDRPARPVALGRQWDVRYMALSPDGRFVAASSWWTGQGTRVYDAATGRPAATLAGLQSTTTKFSPDGRFLLTSDDGITVQLVQVGTWNTVAKPRGMYGAFTGDGRLLALFEKDDTIRLVVTETGRELARFEPPDIDGISWMDFAPDGSRLVVAYHYAKHIKVWNLREIRRRLAELGLDWNAPALPDDDEAKRPLCIQVVGVARIHPAVELVRELLACGAALLHDSSDAQVHYRLGQAFARRGAWANAQRAFDRAVALRPGHAGACFERGLIRSNVRMDFDGAAADFGRALERVPDWLQARLNRALCRAQAGRWEETVAEAGAVLAVQPWNLDARVLRGRALAQSGKHREALADFDEAAALYPYYLPLFELRAASLQALGETQGAAVVIARCVELAANFPQQANSEAWRLATGCALERDPEVACALARRAVESAQQQALYHNTLGVALYRLGRLRDAQAQFRESLRLGSGELTPYDHYFLALCHRRLGEPLRAWAELLRAVAGHGRSASRLTPDQRAELAGFLGEALSGLIHPLPAPG